MLGEKPEPPGSQPEAQTRRSRGFAGGAYTKLGKNAAGRGTVLQVCVPPRPRSVGAHPSLDSTGSGSGSRFPSLNKLLLYNVQGKTPTLPPDTAPTGIPAPPKSVPWAPGTLQVPVPPCRPRPSVLGGWIHGCAGSREAAEPEESSSAPAPRHGRIPNPPKPFSREKPTGCLPSSEEQRDTDRHERLQEEREEGERENRGRHTKADSSRIHRHRSGPSLIPGTASPGWPGAWPDPRHPGGSWRPRPGRGKPSASAAGIPCSGKCRNSAAPGASC